MPKCRECRGTGKDYHGDDFVERFYSNDCRGCDGRGWLPFWTPAERAGLKAMGEQMIRSEYGPRQEAVFIDAICAYVNAARKQKGE